jgi:RND family efflux transporter MFP subunit
MRRIFTQDNRQILLVFIIIAGAVMLSRVFVNSRDLPQSSTSPASLSVTVAELTVGAHPVEIRTTGRVMPRSTVSITPQVSGRIEWISKELYSGGYLLRDQVLFRIEAADYENDLAREHAALARARTDLALENAEADAAIAEWRALNEGIDPPPLVSRDPQIAQAEAELAAAQARLAQAQLNLSRTEYRLPFNGRVISSSLDLGEYVQIGKSYGEIYNQQSLEIVLSLSQTELTWISEPDSVNVNINFSGAGVADSQKVIAGKILRTGAALDDSTRFQELIVKPINDGSLLPGMLTNLVLSGPPVPDIWKLPAVAIQPGEIIWRVDESSTLHRMVPEIISRQPDGVLARLPITTRQITVVNTPLSGAIEGSEVTVLNSVKGSP